MEAPFADMIVCLERKYRSIRVVTEVQDAVSKRVAIALECRERLQQGEDFGSERCYASRYFYDPLKPLQLLRPAEWDGAELPVSGGIGRSQEQLGDGMLETCIGLDEHTPPKNRLMMRVIEIRNGWDRKLGQDLQPPRSADSGQIIQCRLLMWGKQGRNGKKGGGNGPAGFCPET